MNKYDYISDAFKAFMTQAPKQAEAWREMIGKISGASSLDAKTYSLAYLAVLAVTGNHSGIPFHVLEAKEQGITRDEIISAIMLGLPAVGHKVTRALPSALKAFDEVNFATD